MDAHTYIKQLLDEAASKFPGLGLMFMVVETINGETQLAVASNIPADDVAGVLEGYLAEYDPAQIRTRDSLSGH